MRYPDRSDEADLPLYHWREGAVAHIRFCRPKALNAVDVPMAQAFLRACEAVTTDPHVRVVWISGEGRAFMAGGDLAAMLAAPLPTARQLIDGMHSGLRLLASGNAPVIASVQGAVMGAGLGLVLSCDLVLAAEGTRFGFAYTLIGASCDCSTSWGLPRAVGLRKAMELALLADEVSAAEALQMGLINRMVPAAELTLQTEQIVQRLARGPTQAYGQLRRLMRSSLHNDLDTQLDMEAAGFLACAGTQDFTVGVGAFLDKRPAAFGGT